MHPHALSLLLVATGAGIGAMIRYGLTQMAGVYLGAIAMGTLWANAMGSLGIGFLAAYWIGIDNAATQNLRAFLITGLLGGLTTFSAFSYESFALLQQGRYGYALLHSGAHILGGLLLVCLGWWLAEQIR